MRQAFLLAAARGFSVGLPKLAEAVLRIRMDWLEFGYGNKASRRITPRNEAHAVSAAATVQGAVAER